MKCGFMTDKKKYKFVNRLTIDIKNVKNSKSVQTKSYLVIKKLKDFSLVFMYKYNI